MSFNKNTGNSFCERCGHQWYSIYRSGYRKGEFIEPRSCGKCKSKVWNKPRVYGGKYLDGLAPMAKRYKPTGRAAKAKKMFQELKTLFPK